MKIISITSSIAMTGTGTPTMFTQGVGDDGELYQLRQEVTMEEGLFNIWVRVPVRPPKEEHDSRRPVGLGAGRGDNDGINGSSHKGE